MSEIERKLATVEQILEIQPIDGADAIEVATVRGWKVVVKKGEYQVGDMVIYVEIDAFIPTVVAPFLTKPGHFPKVYEGVEGERLRTVKLRGQISQGLILPGITRKDSELYKNRLFVNSPYDDGDLRGGLYDEGADITELLRIVKYEPPIAACLAGVVRGNFPSVIPKTDQERIQNLKKQLGQWQERDLHFEASEKLDGSSTTDYLDLEGEFHVCSRNLNLKEDANNTFWKIALQYGIRERMIEDGLFGYAIQGELIGEGIQDNKYKLTGHDFYVFDIYNANTGKYLTMDERNVFAFQLGLKHVPLIDKAFSVRGHTIESLLAFAQAKSALLATQEREGVVFKCLEDPSISFKAISDLFLVKEK